MRILLTILLFVSLKGSAQLDYTTLPLWRGVGGGRITDSSVTFTISKVRFTNIDPAFQSDLPDGVESTVYISNSSNITFDSCFFDVSYNTPLQLSSSNTITVKNCLFANGNRAIRGDDCTGNIQILNNQIVNVQGYAVSATDGHRGQVFQFANLTGANNLIKGNRGINFFAESYNQDLINVYSSDGSSSDSIMIEDNIFVGGGPSASGGGIIAGDQQGSYVWIRNNKLVNPGQYGVGAGGGTFITITGNEVYDNTARVWNNIGFFALNFSTPGTCDDIYIDNTNDVNYRNAAGSLNPYYSGGGSCGTILPSGNDGPTTGLALATMAIPDPLITMVDSFGVYRLRADTTFDYLIKIKGLLQTFGPPPDSTDLTRPTCGAGSDQSITSTTATLTGTATATATNVPGHNGYNNTIYSVRWVQVSGPTTATMSAATSLTNNLSNLSTGTYEFMLEATQNTDQYDYKSFMFDFMEIEVSIASDPPYPPGVKIPIKM